jgi:hypothetical protein
MLCENKHQDNNNNNNHNNPFSKLLDSVYPQVQSLSSSFLEVSNNQLHTMIIPVQVESIIEIEESNDIIDKNKTPWCDVQELKYEHLPESKESTLSDLQRQRQRQTVYERLVKQSNKPMTITRPAGFLEFLNDSNSMQTSVPIFSWNALPYQSTTPSRKKLGTLLEIQYVSRKDTTMTDSYYHTTFDRFLVRSSDNYQYHISIVDDALLLQGLGTCIEKVHTVFRTNIHLAGFTSDYGPLRQGEVQYMNIYR